MKRIGILISGRGSNMLAVLKAIEAKKINASVVTVLSHKEASGLNIAKSYNCDTHVINDKSFATRDDYEKELLNYLNSKKIDLLILAGYMKLVGDTLLNAFEGRMINIHPSLLPSFKGLNAQKQAFDAGVKLAGCSVHFVTKDLDGGPIILQEAVPVLDSDTLDSLSARILEAEHRILPQAVQLFVDGQLYINTDGKVLRK